MLKQFKIQNTDLSVSRLAMGTAKISVGKNKAESKRVLDTFLDLGGNLYDTARVYGCSEEVIGSWIKSTNKREKIVLMTKGGHPELSENLNCNISDRIYRGMRRRIGIPVMPKIRNAKKEMRLDLEKSLRNLQTDYIDIYLYHRDDLAMSVEQLIETMEDFVREGKIRYYGCSNWSTKRIEEADRYCRGKGYRGFVTNQVLYNIGVQGMKKMSDPTMRKMDAQMIGYHKQRPENVAMAYSGVCSGFFHKLNNDIHLKKSEYYSKTNLACLEHLKMLMGKYGATLTQAELGFLITQEFCCVPLYGPRNVEDLMEAAQAFEIPFTAADYRFGRMRII